ncbi:hypothetical protein ACTXT7_009197 [Hymenolepis weldensis]
MGEHPNAQFTNRKNIHSANGVFRPSKCESRNPENPTSFKQQNHQVNFFFTLKEDETMPYRALKVQYRCHVIAISLLLHNHVRSRLSDLWHCGCLLTTEQQSAGSLGVHPSAQFPAPTTSSLFTLSTYVHTHSLFSVKLVA